MVLLRLNTISCADPPADSYVPFYNWADVNYSARNEYLQSVNWKSVFQTCFDAESCRASFHLILTDALDIFVPHICPKVTRRKDKPNHYYPRYIRDLIETKLSLGSVGGFLVMSVIS